MTYVSAMVLAAGLSSRMGEFKPLLPYNNKTIIASVIESLLNSNVNEIVVITGYNKELVEQNIKKYNIRTIFNPDYEIGMHSSVITGVNNINSEANWLMVLLGDQPHISTIVINKLIDTINKTDRGIIIPSYKNKRGHPILINRKHFEGIKKITPDTGLKQLITNNSEDIFYLAIEDDAILFDIDTPDDYKKLLEKY